MIARDELLRNVSYELELSEDERLIRLGKQSTPSGLGSDADDFDDDHYKRLGQSLLSQIAERARRQICESTEIRSVVTQMGEPHGLALIAPIADVLATFLSGPAIFTATASIISIGLTRYCHKFWNSAEGGNDARFVGKG